MLDFWEGVCYNTVIPVVVSFPADRSSFGVITMFVACRAAKSKGELARCPKRARTPDGFCTLHAEPSLRGTLPEPELIILRYQLTSELADVATKMGIRVAERSPERQAQLSASRDREARARWDRRTGTTGTLIFGPEGLKRVRLADLLGLKSRGFHLNDPHIVWWAATGIDHLVLSFTKTEPKEAAPGGWAFYEEHLKGGVFDSQVYHNPPNLAKDGHADNYNVRCQFAEGEPLHELSYDGHDWIAKAIQTTPAVTSL